MQADPMNKLERGLIRLAKADAEDDYAAGGKAMDDVMNAWVVRSPEAQAAWLDHHPRESSLGGSLRSVLAVYATNGTDLGDMAHAQQWMREHNKGLASR